MIRRATALGIAVAATTPVVQGLGRIGAFAQVSPPPPTYDEPVLPSHIQLIVTFAGSSTRYGVKWDQRWEGLGQQGNVCWKEGDAVLPFERATADQLAYLAEARVAATSRGYEVDLPSAVEAVAAAATFDGNACYLAGDPEGPYWDDEMLVFPKPTGR
jgi:hypothetical protein